MDKKKLISELNDVIKANNLKKSEVEQRIGFPQNGLSNILSGKKDLPDKWVNPITSYIECFDSENQIHPLSGRELAETMGVKTANKVPSPQKEKWVIEVERFCNENNCSYKDLIEAYKNRLKVGKKETSKMPIIQDLTPANNPTGSNWFENYRKQKLGLGK